MYEMSYSQLADGGPLSYNIRYGTIRIFLQNESLLDYQMTPTPSPIQNSHECKSTNPNISLSKILYLKDQHWIIHMDLNPFLPGNNAAISEINYCPYCGDDLTDRLTNTIKALS